MATDSEIPTNSEILEALGSPEMLASWEADLELVTQRVIAALNEDRPIDDEFIEELAEERLELATAEETWLLNPEAPGATLESSRKIVRGLTVDLVEPSLREA